MIFVILGLSVLITFIAIIIDDVDISTFMGSAGVLLFIASLVVAICLGIGVKNHSVIDDRIAMYEEENAKIEEQISVVVKEYMEFEADVFADVSPDSAITLISLYPELKSDTLVASLIDVYLDNNDTIKFLKEKQIKGSVLKWWLYFGA